MSKKVRIDFVIREVPDEESKDGFIGTAEARGISFGDEVPTDHIYEFMNRCRDAANTLFNGKRPSEVPEITEEMLRAEIAKMRAQAAAQYGGGHAVPATMISNKPSARASSARTLDDAYASLMESEDDNGNWDHLKRVRR